MTRLAQFLAFVFFFSFFVKGEVTELREVQVTAKLIKDGKLRGSTTSIKAEDLLRKGAVTLPDSLQREPGVSVPLDVAGVDSLVPYLEGGSNSINIRGLEGNRVQVLVDGIAQPDDFVVRSFQGSGGPGRIYFDPAVFSSLDLLRTASPGSGSLAGTVTGQTESPFTLLGDSLIGKAFSSTSTYSSNNRSWNERFSGAWGNGDLASSIVYSYRQGHELENNSGIPANPTYAKSHAVIWKTVIRNGSLTVLPTIDFFRSKAFTNLDSIETESLIGRTINASSDSVRSRFRVSLDFDFEPDSEDWFADKYTGKLYNQTSESRNLNLQGVLTPFGGLRDRVNDLSYYTNRAGINLAASKELQMHSLTYEYQVARSDISGSLNRQDGLAAPIDLPNLAPSIVWDHSITMVDEISIGDRWFVSPALRFQYSRVNPTNTPEFLAQTALPVFDEVGRLIGQRTIAAIDYENKFLSPSVLLEYEKTDELSFFGSYTRGFRNPTAEELAGVFVHPNNLSISLPNPDLRAEDSDLFELGFRHESSSWNSVFTAYYNRYGNFLESNVPTGEVIDGLNVLRTENATNTKIYGVELKSEWSVGCLRLGGTFGWSEGVSGAAPLNTVEPWKAVAWAGFTGPDDKWGMELAGTYVAAKPEAKITGDLPATDDFFLLDLIGHYRFSDRATLRGGVRNLLDQEYVLWARANRGSGHAGGVTSGIDTQPGVNGFLALEITF